MIGPVTTRVGMMIQNDDWPSSDNEDWGNDTEDDWSNDTDNEWSNETDNNPTQINSDTTPSKSSCLQF